LQSLSAVQNGGKELVKIKKIKTETFSSKKFPQKRISLCKTVKKQTLNRKHFFYVGVEKERKLKCQEHFQSKKDLGEMLRENR
jgi:hypothetical protein